MASPLSDVALFDPCVGRGRRGAKGGLAIVRFVAILST